MVGLVSPPWLSCFNFKANKLSLEKIPTSANMALAELQRYTYRVLQTIQMKVILLWVWAELAVLGRAKTALRFKYEI